MRDYAKIEQELITFLKNYLQKSGAKNLLLGVSGGLDSAVVAHLCAKAKPKNTHALIMPSNSSNPKNTSDAIALCESLKINFKLINISEILNSYQKNIDEKLNNLRLANLSARIRMSLLYDYSAAINALVVGTSNKSELLLGYSTIYGDMACALNPIGGLYKSEIFEFAKFLKIKEEIIKKAPSADLWEGQSDEAELGYSYEILDEVLRFIQGEAISKNIDKNLSDEILKRVKKNSFKRQMPPIAQI